MMTSLVWRRWREVCSTLGLFTYADDSAFLIKLTAEAVSSLNSFSETASALGFRVSWPKTKLQSRYQYPATSCCRRWPLCRRCVVVDTVDSLDNFIYLGSVLCSDGYSRPDINWRIGLASSVMSALSHIFKDRCLSLTTKPVFVRP